MHKYLLLALLCVPLGATVNVRDYGAQGDGVANDTAPLNAAFSAACTVSDDVYIPAGTYLTSSFDSLNGCGISFYGDGSNSILKLLSVAGPVGWEFTGGLGKALTIRDMVFDGGHLAGAGISIERYQSVTIKHVIVHDFGTPGYRMGHKRPYDGLYIRNVENALILDSEFNGNERYGVELQAVHNSTVLHCVMSRNGSLGGVSEQNFAGPLDGPLVAQWLDNLLASNGSGGIDVETDPKLPPAQGILQGNRVIDCGNDNWGSGWALVIGMHSFGTITGNRVERFAADASPGDYTSAIVYGRNGGPISIINNVVDGTKSHAIVGDYGAFPVTISGNTLTHNGTGIYIYKSPRVQIINNTVSNSSKSGIDVSWSTGSTIFGNQLTGNLRDLRINGRQAIQR